MSKYLESLNWRYATKKFDADKKVSPENLESLLEAVSLSASSYGLQPYKIFVIEDLELREKLKPAAWGQSQITDASHLVVFTNQSTFGNELVDDFIQNLSETRGIPFKDLEGYADFMKSKLVTLSESSKATWTARQTYLALGNLLSAAADLKIDSCPMEGFDSAEFNNILGLTEQGLNAAVLVAIGHRSEEDDTQHYKKVRKSRTELITHL